MTISGMPLYVLAGAVGLIVGSFLNVCIWRIPRGESIVWPSSKCPDCGAPIKPWDNVPVLSYLILRGRCRQCKSSISLRYPIVEAMNGLLYVFTLYRFGQGWHTVFYMALASSLIVVTFVDLEHQIIPDRITVPGVLIGIALSFFILPDPFKPGFMLGWKNSLIGAGAGFVFFYAVAVLSKGGMGGGDIKLMAMVGSIVGWKGVALTTFIGSLTGAIAGVLIIIFKGGGRKTKVPFGPFLALGTLISLYFGGWIWSWYLHD